MSRHLAVLTSALALCLPRCQRLVGRLNHCVAAPLDWKGRLGLAQGACDGEAEMIAATVDYLL